MGTIVDYLEYLKAHEYKDKSVQRVLVMVDHIHPKIEEIIRDAIIQMAQSAPPTANLNSYFDLTIISSLSFILAQYLTDLASRPNEFNVDEDTLEQFITNLIQGMINTCLKKM